MTFASVALSEHLGAYAVVGPKIVGPGGADGGIRERDDAHCEDPDSSGDAVAAQHVRLGSRVGFRAQHAAQCSGVPALPHPDLDYHLLVLGPSEDLEKGATLESGYCREIRGDREGCRVRYASTEAAYPRCYELFPLLGGNGGNFGRRTVLQYVDS